jgi:hypothetical protein
MMKPEENLLSHSIHDINFLYSLLFQGTDTQRILMSSATLKIPSAELERLNDTNVFQTTPDLDNRLYPHLEYTTDEQRLTGLSKRALSDRGETRLWSDPPALRLAEGPTPLMGRLQVYHRGQWRSVCTNSRK